jgi:hypothetical protein
MTHTIDKLLRARTSLLGKPPFTPETLWEYKVGEDAVALFRQYSQCFYTRMTGSIHLTVGKQGWHVGLHHEVPELSTVYLVTDFPAELQMKMVEWSDRILQYDVERVEIMARVEKVMSAANTVGQIVRVWPAIGPLFPTHHRQRVVNARCKSKLSDRMVIITGEGEQLIPDLKPEYLWKYDHVLSEALMLKDVCRDQEDELYHFYRTN